MQLTDSSELTISAGAVTVTANFYRVDTQGDTSSDDLDTITAGTGVADGHVLWLRPENTTRTVVVKHNTGNIWCALGQDIVLDDTREHTTLVYDANLTKWLAVGPRSPIFRRQGGSATIWAADGTTTYVPSRPRIQAGACATASSIAGGATGSVTVTFPDAFAQAPLVFVTAVDDNKVVASVDYSGGFITATDFQCRFYNAGSTNTIKRAFWLAIGE